MRNRRDDNDLSVDGLITRAISPRQFHHQDQYTRDAKRHIFARNSNRRARECNIMAGAAPRDTGSCFYYRAVLSEAAIIAIFSA